jgi:hypothetical protein
MKSPKTDDSIPSQLVGIAAEHFVVAELCRRGYIASLTARNTRGVDIQVSDLEESTFAHIQVKGIQAGRNRWPLNEKAESLSRPRLFYVFVRLAGMNERPEFYIIPSDVVAKHVKADHTEWIHKPGLHGQPHQPTRMRQFPVTAAATYRDKWDVLGLPAAKAKV